VHLLNHYAAAPYLDNRRGLFKLADVPVTINERRIGPVTKAFRLGRSGKDECDLPLHREGPWVEARIDALEPYEIVVLEH
jgi:hypothetical protein